MSSDDPNRPGSPDEAAQAGDTTDPTIQAEIDEKASIDEPSGAEATPGSGDASERDPMPAPGAPGELDSDDAGTEPAASPADQVIEGGDEPSAGAGDQPPTASAASAATAPAGTSEPASVPEQPAPAPADDPLSGGASAASAADKDATAETVAEVADAAEEPEISEPAEVDELRQALVDTLREHLGDALVEHHIEPGIDVLVRVRTDAWRQAGLVARDHLNLQYFSFLSAIDWMPSPYGKSEDSGLGDEPRSEASSDIETGVCGGDTRMQVFARVHSVTRHVGLTLKADVPDDDPRIESWTPIYRGADWHERETAEMFGIVFTGHPNLVNLYLPGEFHGHPLRKDFPLLSREVKPWPGLVDVEAMPGEDPEPAEAVAGSEEGS